MKKTILLLATVLSVSTSFAQYNTAQQSNWDNAYGYYQGRNNRYVKGRDRSYFFTVKERDAEIAQINKEATKAVRSIKSRFFMDRDQKRRQIQSIEQKRDADIGLVWARYNDRDNKGDNKDRG